MKYLNYPYYSIDLFAHITIFYLCILSIIAIQNKYVLFAFSGLCIVEIGNFAMMECYLENNLSKLAPGEFCFLLGLFMLSIGMLNIIKNKLDDPKKWFFESNTIRNKFSFLIFSISIWSYIIACIVMRQFSTINNSSLVFVPAIGMLYSMGTAVLYVIVSKQMEKPFLQIQARIKSLFEENDKDSHTNINLIEFQQLNNFIIESYEYKTSLEKHIISMATRIAHDIKSPLQIIENLIKNNENSMLQEKLVKQINKISYISKSLLKENKKIIDDDSYGLQSLYSIIEDLTFDKQIEWNTEYSVINFEYNSKQIIWLDNEQVKIKNIISNLLNNSFEAMVADSEHIKINLTVNLNNQNIIIYIQDFGSGMSDETLNMIRRGKTLKVNGNGIGVVSAEKFMNEINGKFDIKTQLNYGTTIKLEFPKLIFAPQFATEVQLYTNHIVVVDDNSTIINFWQEFFLFSRPRKRVEYFINFRSLSDFLSRNNHNEVTYLIDYHIFGEKTTGVDIIKKFNLKNVYLITDSAEDIKLQDEIKLLEVKLVPKIMLHIVLQNKGFTKLVSDK